MTAAAQWDPKAVARAALGATDGPSLSVIDAIDPFPIQPIGTLLSDPDLSRPPEWIVESLFVRASLNVIYGAGKIGKSTMLAHLAVCVALGLPFAGLRTKAGPVLWLDLEQGRGRLARSLQSVPGIQTADLPLFVHSDLSERGRSTSALAATLRTQAFALVIVDSLGKFAQVDDENDNAAWQRSLQVLEELARNGTAAIVLIDHDRKSEGEHGRGLRGGSSKLAAMDCAVHVKRVPGKEQARRLEVVSRERGSFTVDLSLTDDGYSAANRPVDVVEQALQTVGSMSLASLLLHLENAGFRTPRSTVRARLDVLLQDGRIVASGKGTKTDPLMYSAVGHSGDVADSGGATICRNAEDTDG